MEQKNKTERIASFKIDHMRLEPGIYISRTEETTGGDILVTYDIRLRRPNFEDALTPEICHTMEHLGAMFLRNHPEHGNHIVYFGPMGCLTGMYLIYRWTSDQHMSMQSIASLILSMMKFIVVYSGNMPSVGFDPESCGNYSLNDIDGAKNVAANFLTLDDAFGTLKFEYPNDDNAAGVATSTQIFGNDKINNVLNQCRRIRQNINIDYSVFNIESQSEIINDVHCQIQHQQQKTDKTDSEISIEDFIKSVRTEDIALHLKKKCDAPNEETVRKAFPRDDDAPSEETAHIQKPIQNAVEPGRFINKISSNSIAKKKKKKVTIAYTGDALF